MMAASGSGQESRRDTAAVGCRIVQPWGLTTSFRLARKVPLQAGNWDQDSSVCCCVQDYLAPSICRSTA